MTGRKSEAEGATLCQMEGDKDIFHGDRHAPTAERVSGADSASRLLSSGNLPGCPFHCSPDYFISSVVLLVQPTSHRQKEEVVCSSISCFTSALKKNVSCKIKRCGLSFRILVLENSTSKPELNLTISGFMDSLMISHQMGGQTLFNLF